MSIASESLSDGGSFRSNLRRLFKSRVRGSARTHRPSIDVLEDRTTPSTILVTTAVDPVGRLVPGSLRWAIARANHAHESGSTIEITPAVDDAIVLRVGELRIATSLTIENATGRPLTIAQAAANSRVFHVLDAAGAGAVTIKGGGSASPLTITGGRARDGDGGGILVDDAESVLTLSHVNVVGNSAAQVSVPRRGTKGNGGGILTRGSVTLYQSSVSGNVAIGTNSASGHAGGVYADRGVTLVASHVDSNRSRNAGGILNVFNSVEVLDGSTVNGNTSTRDSFQQGDFGGGGIAQINGNVIISGSQVNGNRTAGQYSGGIVLLIGGVTIANGSQVNGNSNNGPGGGIAANFGGQVVVTGGSQVNGNTGAGVGGGVVNWSDTFGVGVYDRSEVSGNVLTDAEDSGIIHGLIDVASDPAHQRALLSGGRGDAALAEALRLFIANCRQRLDSLQVAADALPGGGSALVGAGIATVLGGGIDVRDSTVGGNTFRNAPGHEDAPLIGIGGGLFANLGAIAIDRGTIRDNVADGDGGGIWSGRALAISDSLVSGNVARLGRGGGIFNRGTFESSDTGVVGNTPDDVFP